MQAPVLTHLTWSVLMLRFLPPLFESAIAQEQHQEARAADTATPTSSRLLRWAHRD